MSVNLRNLAIVAYGNGFNLWHYRAETLASTLEEAFWNDAFGMFYPGDRIMVSASDGSHDLWVRVAQLYCVVVEALKST